MTKAYKSLGCEASYCASQHYAGGLCRKHYTTSRAAHPAGKGDGKAKVDALLIENIEMGFKLEDLRGEVARLTQVNQSLQKRLDT